MIEEMLFGGGWNYRVLTDGEQWWVAEVYYDKDGNPTGCTDGEGILTEWETEDELHATILHVVEAFAKPVLDVADLDRF